MSAYEALTLMIAFATLVVLMLGFTNNQKSNHLIHFSEAINGYNITLII